MGQPNKVYSSKTNVRRTVRRRSVYLLPPGELPFLSFYAQAAEKKKHQRHTEHGVPFCTQMPTKACRFRIPLWILPLPVADVSFVAVRLLFLNICVVRGTGSVDWKICFNTTHVCNTQQCWQLHLNSLSNLAPILYFARGSICCGLLCAAWSSGSWQ